MSVKVTDEKMTSDKTEHSAEFRQHASADGQGAWVVSWIPERLFTRSQATTAMVLAEREWFPLSMRATDWSRLEHWAAELGLTADEAVRRIGQN